MSGLLNFSENVKPVKIMFALTDAKTQFTLTFALPLEVVELALQCKEPLLPKKHAFTFLFLINDDCYFELHIWRIVREQSYITPLCFSTV